CGNLREKYGEFQSVDSSDNRKAESDITLAVHLTTLNLLQHTQDVGNCVLHIQPPAVTDNLKKSVFLHEGVSGIRTDKTTFVVVLWMGYVNSGLNPIVYAVLNREFRMAYKKLLFCRKRNAHKQGSHIIYRTCQSRNEQCHQLVLILDDNEPSSDITKDTGISKEESERKVHPAL
ncbi:alpha-1A adrenergic receptor-like, partial [Mobula hypostoma]|uniref:alpha-1A adrenergic receptor-like n=1 Tax=Mobula hypostoma TaxID=723540 RepID=UPI002FC363F1